MIKKIESVELEIAAAAQAYWDSIGTRDGSELSYGRARGMLEAFVLVYGGAVAVVIGKYGIAIPSVVLFTAEGAVAV